MRFLQHIRRLLPALALPALLCAQPAAAAEDPDIFIRPELSQKKGYVGEQIDYTLKLYTTSPNLAYVRPMVHILPEGCDVRVVNDLKEPYFEGSEKIDGKEYAVAVIERKVIEPLSKGTIRIPAIEYRIGVNFKQLVNRDFFWGEIYNTVTKDYTVKSKDLKISVRPLPAGAPADFTGAIGEFGISASLPKGKVRRGEENFLYVTVKGSGSLPEEASIDMNLLQAKWGKIVRIRRVSDSEQSYWQEGRYVSEREYQVTFVPESSGELTLPPIDFCYLNSRTGRYTTASSEPLVVNVVSPNSSGKQSGTITI